MFVEKPPNPPYSLTRFAVHLAIHLYGAPYEKRYDPSTARRSSQAVVGIKDVKIHRLELCVQDISEEDELVSAGVGRLRLSLEAPLHSQRLLNPSTTNPLRLLG